MADDNPSIPPKINPLAPRPATLKLKPIIRPAAGGLKPGLKLPPKPAAAPVTTEKAQTSSLDQLKSVTQNLKSVTAPIPQQAILHKTGIIADPSLTAAQMAAAKARTSRISLSDAIGVAPVKNEPAPMKTIRIKRPVDLPGVSAPASTPDPVAAAPAAETPVAESAKPATSEVESTTVTQRKTLKIARPGGAVRPAGKFGIKRPAAPTPAKSAEPAAAEATGDAIADIPDITEEGAAAPANPMPAAADAAPVAGTEKDVPKGIAVMGLLIQAAACVAMGLLVYRLYVDTAVSPF